MVLCQGGENSCLFGLDHNRNVIVCVLQRRAVTGRKKHC